MQLTPNYAIAYADTSDDLSIEDITAAMADSVDDALVLLTGGNGGSGSRALQTYRWANIAARASQTGMVGGARGYQADTKVTYLYSGSAWLAWDSEWISYTPTLTNFTIGTGGVAANTAQYKYDSGMVIVEGGAFLGTSGASVGAGVSFTLPVTAATPRFTNVQYSAAATLFDTSAPATQFGIIRANGTSTTSVQLLSASAWPPVNITSAVPWTWAAGDGIDYKFTYRPA